MNLQHLSNLFAKRLFFIFCIYVFSTNANAQWQFQAENPLQTDVIINYDIVYDKPVTEKQKQAPSYCDNIVVVFNSNIMKIKKVHRNTHNRVFTILDYNKHKGYNCYEKQKQAIKYSFKKPHKDVTVLDETQSILKYTCNVAFVDFYGKKRSVLYTKAFGLKYCDQFKVDGFILEYPGYSKKYGTYRAIAKTIHYKTLDASFYSLDGFKVYTREEYKALRSASSEKYEKEKLAHLGKSAKKFSTTTIFGKKVSSKKNLGKVTVLNFWFTSCPPCKKEIPQLNKLVDTFKDNPDVNFISFALDPEYKLAAFLKEHRFKYEIVGDARYLADKYDIKGYPTNIVIDKTGIVRLRERGYRNDIFERLEYQINKALKE